MLDLLRLAALFASAPVVAQEPDGTGKALAALAAYVLLIGVGGWLLLNGRGTELPPAVTAIQ